MTLPMAVTYFALALSALNWLLFLALTYLHDLPMIEKLVHHVTMTHHTTKAAPGGEKKAAVASIDLGDTLKSSGDLAEAFKKAGAAPTAAALSFACLLVALVASGVAKLPDAAAKPAPAATASPTAVRKVGTCMTCPPRAHRWTLRFDKSYVSLLS